MQRIADRQAIQFRDLLGDHRLVFVLGGDLPPVRQLIRNGDEPLMQLGRGTGDELGHILAGQPGAAVRAGDQVKPVAVHVVSVHAVDTADIIQRAHLLEHLLVGFLRALRRLLDGEISADAAAQLFDRVAASGIQGQPQQRNGHQRDEQDQQQHRALWISDDI